MSKAKILVVEDTGIVAKDISDRLSYMGYKVTGIVATAKDVFEQISDKVDMILDGGRTDIGIESTIISLIGKPRILRPGGLPVEDIEKIIGKVKLQKHSKKIESPGRMKKHYAPGTKMEFITLKTKLPEGKNIGLLAFEKPPANKNQFKIIEILSPDAKL